MIDRRNIVRGVTKVGVLNLDMILLNLVHTCTHVTRSYRGRLSRILRKLKSTTLPLGAGKKWTLELLAFDEKYDTV
jgi:hypothetical protein